MLEHDGEAWAVRDDRMQHWSPTGYGRSRPLPEGEASVLTPPTTVAALAAGYAALWHPTAS
jgi:hypothetical protein